MDDMELELGGEVSKGQDLSDSVCFERRWSRIEEGRVLSEWASWGKWWVGALNVIANGVSDGRNHFGVKHQCRGRIFQLLESQLDVC